MPTASDQFLAVLNAPLPFALALLAVAVVIWGGLRFLYQWRYDGVIEKLNAMLRLAAEENRIQKDRQADTEADLTEVEKKLDELVKAKGAEGGAELQSLKEDLSKLRLAVESSSSANTAVDDALRRGAALTGATLTGTSSLSAAADLLTPKSGG